MASNSNNAVVQMQKIASDTQIKLQQMTDASSAKTFAYNTAEAEKSRKWQTEMSNTSHQREVKDLIKAGLNPVLSSGGSGAQGYTTSSASGQADNAANAVASLQASRMSGLANIESSTISAKAQRAAAAASARAMKEAAATQAAAARYAAAMNYQSSVYRADKSYQATKYAWDMKKQITFNAPTGNPVKMIDKYFGSSSQATGSESLITRLKSIVKTSVNDFNKNPEKYFYKPVDGQPITKDNFQLNTSGYRTIRNRLQELGLTASPSLCNTYVKAFKFGDQKAIRAFKNQLFIAKNSYSKVKARKWNSSI